MKLWRGNKKKQKRGDKLTNIVDEINQMLFVVCGILFVMCVIELIALFKL
jgi:hypothetical protein